MSIFIVFTPWGWFFDCCASEYLLKNEIQWDSIYTEPQVGWCKFWTKIGGGLTFNSSGNLYSNLMDYRAYSEDRLGET